MGLPFPFLLALRYLRSSRRDSYVRLLATLAGGGVALGVATLVLVLSALNGLQDFLRADVLSRTPHLEIELPPEADARAELAALRELPGVVSGNLLLRGRAWVLLGGQAENVRIVGFEGELPAIFPGADSREEGLYVGDGQAATWGLTPGDRVEIISPRPTLTPMGPQPRLHGMTLTGTFRTGRTEDLEQRIAVPLAMAERLLGRRQARIELVAESLEAALALAPSLQPSLPEGSRLATWKDLNKGLFFALRLEKSLMFLAVFLVVPVASMALVTVLVLLIASKKGEIGMLRALGARAVDLRRAFLTLGGLLAGLGLLCGGALGLAGAWAFDRYRLLKPPGDVYYLSHIPFDVEPRDLLLITLATASLTLASTLYAARRASALRPVEAIRR